MDLTVSQNEANLSVTGAWYITATNHNSKGGVKANPNRNSNLSPRSNLAYNPNSNPNPIQEYADCSPKVTWPCSAGSRH
jgi:hypothetical protein